MLDLTRVLCTVSSFAAVKLSDATIDDGTRISRLERCVLDREKRSDDLTSIKISMFNQFKDARTSSHRRRLI